MTLQDYLKIFRHRWLVIAACTLAAAAVMWAVTPASTDTTLKVGSYTATATLLVGSSDANETSVSMARIPLYLTTGEVPKRAAEAVGYDGDPALLASGLTVTPDYQAQAPPQFTALRSQDYLFVVYRNGERELYDLHADPNEMNNIAATADPALVAGLYSQLQAMRACAGDTCRTADSLVVPTATTAS